MRDPERIDPFLHKLGELWKRHPDQRFGQLVMNLSRAEDGSFVDHWLWENDAWLRRIDMYEKDAKIYTDFMMRELRARMSALGVPDEELDRLQAMYEAENAQQQADSGERYDHSDD